MHAPSLVVGWLARGALNEMLREAESRDPLETGGVLLGYWTVDDSHVVITHATGPGPDARHGRTTFRPDTSFQERVVAEIYAGSGRRVTYLGDWHTHPGGSVELSAVDKRTLHGIAKAPEARTEKPIMAVLAGGKEWYLALWLATRTNKSRAGAVTIPTRVYS